MDQLAIAADPGSVGVIDCDYGAVRAAFQRVLGLYTEKLKRSDFQLAADLLGCAISSDLSEGIADMSIDTALYSRPGEPWQRRAARRAVDRIAGKITFQRDPLMAVLASRLTTASYSVFEVESVAGNGALLVKDVLDSFRPLTIVDMSLAATAQPGAVFAGRFLDVGSWCIGFGIVHTLTKSEATAISLALTHEGELEDRRDALHELVYSCRIHGDALVLAALTPLIAAISLAIDTSEDDLALIVAGLAAAPAMPERARPTRVNPRTRSRA